MRRLGFVVAVLVGVEIASGAIQGYYGPVLVDLADRVDVRHADLNWLEAAQLLFSALVVPPLARLGDLIGHRTVLLLATAVTAAATWMIAFAPSFWLLLVAWTLQGIYVVWLPIEVAIIHRRTAGRSDQRRITRRVAAALVATLELSLIVAALTSGQLADRMSLTTMLMLPAIVVTLCLPALLLLPGDAPASPAETFDWSGLGLLVLALLVAMGGLVLVRLEDASTPAGWVLVIVGCLALVPWWRFEAGRVDPLVDVRLLARPAQWSIQLTAVLLGMSLLGTQVPLSAYFRSDPAITGYGFDLTAAQTSQRLALFVLCLALGALALPVASRVVGSRGAMIAGCLLNAAGYLGWLPLHDSIGAVWLLLAVCGLGSGVLVAAIPAAAAAAAPLERVGSATGLSNAAKAIGGAVASSVFAICLSSSGAVEVDRGSIDGYLAVWSICAGSALVAALVLAVTARAARAAVTRDPAGPARSLAR